MNNEAHGGTTSGISKLMPAERICRSVYIVHDDPDERRAVSMLLEAANYAVSPYTCAKALLSVVDEKTTGILILDLSLADMSGLVLQNELQKRGIGLKTIFISASATIGTSVQAIKGGAVDFLAKPFTDEQLLNSVEEALAAAIAEEKKRRQRSALENRYNRLTRREREIMNLLIRGDSSRKLAERLGLSSRTVEIHRSKIMRKLEAETLPDLVRMVYTNGDFQPEEVLIDISPSLLLQKDKAG
jgi:two-component system, LuxR family, response regulator FixJ